VARVGVIVVSKKLRKPLAHVLAYVFLNRELPY